METLQILSLSDLRRVSLPLTGAASLRSPEPSPHPSKKLKPLYPPPPPLPGIPFLLPNPNPNSDSFTPIPLPVLLIGTVDLPSAATATATNRCFSSRDHCLSFSDGSSTVCCAILDFDPIILRRTIHVFAWNFLPSVCAKVGFLEVIRWRLAPSEVVASDCDPFLSVLPRDGGCLSARAKIFGVLKSVSPVFMVPLASQNRENGGESVGFLTEIATCKCEVCRCSIFTCDLESRLREKGDHSFAEKEFVYFVKPTCLWRPVLVKMIGKVIILCGLKKKAVSVGGGESYLMFLPTEKTSVSLCRLPVGMLVRKLATAIRSDPGAYCGVVTGVYMQGMVVELDQKVWLMITDPRIVQQHSLRVGALIRVTNSHIICVEYAWTKILLLGTSSGTHVEIMSFSSSDTRCHFRNQNGSLLREFIESLTFSARFWVLLLVSCLRQKLSSILSTEKILGSRNKEGLAQIYARSYLPPDAFQSKNGVFMGFCNHYESISRTDCNLMLLKLVVPISIFVSKCEAILVSSTSKREGASSIKRKDYFNQFSLGVTSCGLIRRIIPSDEVGCILIGTLKICSSSGRLQLVDATGGVDVVIPDLPSQISVQNIYEVKDYKVVLEGLPTQIDALRHHSDTLWSCRNIFGRFSYRKVLNQIGVYVHFSIGNSSCLNACFQPSSFIRDDLHRISNKKFHLLLVTHKFPDSGSFHRDSGISNGFMYAEAIVLPYNLNIPRADDYEQLPGDLGKIACLLTFRNANHRLCSQSGYICNAEGDIIDRQRPRRVLLEFKSDCSHRFQLLLLGAYYTISCSGKGHGCSIKSCQDFSFGKALVTPESILWRISFAFGDSPPISQLSPNQPSGISSSRLENASLGTYHQNELSFQLDQSKIHEISDAHLHVLPKDGKLGQEERNPVNDCFFRFIGSLSSCGSVLSVSACIKIMMDTFVGLSEAENPECTKLMPGNLISLRGNIGHLHTYHCKSTSVCSADVVNFVDSSACNVCVHLYDDLQMVRIRGTIRKCAYPVGMGPGVNATFHRVLMTWRSSQWRELVLTPVTFVVINSVNEIDSEQIREGLVTDSGVDIRDGSFNFLSFSLIPELVQRREPKLIRLNCRVLAIHLLVLEEHTQHLVKSNPIGNIKIPLVDIPFAGLVVDDGSSLSCCWVNAGRAATLLNLQATAYGTFFGCLKSKGGESKSSHISLGYHLENTLKKHHRVVVQSRGELTDPSSVEHTFSVDSHKALSYSEESLLKFITLNACSGMNFTVVGNTMDCDVLERLRLELLELHVPILSMENIWVQEVENIDPLDEARSILQELSKPK